MTHPHQKIATRFRRRMRLAPRAIALLLAPVLLAFGAAPLSAEEESPALAQYRRQVEVSIDKGLAFLAGQQMTKERAAKLGKPTLAGSIVEKKLGNTGITSLSVLAFLSKGHTPGLGPYGEVVNRGVDYIVSQQHPNGLLVCKDKGGQTHGHMYSHFISTLLLAEVSGMVEPRLQKKIDEALPKALALTLNAQRIKKSPKHQGGWRYQPTARDSDMSLTGWAVMSLRAAKLNGAPVPDESIKGAVQFILSCNHPGSGGFGYTPGSGSKLGLTGAGILCLELCGEHGHKSIRPAGDFILQHKPGTVQGMAGFYDVYYCSQAMFQLGGHYWEEWASWLYVTLPKIQQPDGRWPPADATTASCYTTSLSILAMTPAYRQLPIYQRDDSYNDQPPPTQ